MSSFSLAISANTVARFSLPLHVAVIAGLSKRKLPVVARYGSIRISGEAYPVTGIWLDSIATDQGEYIHGGGIPPREYHPSYLLNSVALDHVRHLVWQNSGQVRQAITEVH